MRIRQLVAVCLSVTLAAAQQSQTPVVSYQPGAIGWLTGPYRQPSVSVPGFNNAPRLRGLIRAGNIYLSLSDAIALAIENNLDIELDRYAFPLASSELERTKGGGLLRGINYTIAQPPAGTGGPSSPLITNTATASTPGVSIASNALELAALGEPQSNLSVLGSLPLSNGPAIPTYDPTVNAQYNWLHESVPQANSFLTGTPLLLGTIQSGDASVTQGFGTGTQASLSFNNASQTYNAIRNLYNPYITSNLALTITQPLLRGFGPAVNRRFIRIAKNEGKITSLLFRQQLIETVYGVVRLYTDLVSLDEDVRVKRDTLRFANKLLEDTQSEVTEGTLAPVELTRARAEVSAAEQDLINSQGVRDEQEAILKNVLTKRGNEDPEVRAAHIIPTDPLSVPETESTGPIEQLLEQAYRERPDLAQAGLQVTNSELSLKGSMNNLRPEVDLVGIAENNALAGDPFPQAGPPDPAFIGGYGAALEQLATRKNPTYGIGLNVTLPLRNRVAQADAARDTVQLRQSQVRERQLRNQVQLEVEDALIAMRRSRASYQAALRTRELQQQSLEIEQLKFSEGASTSFFVIQYESYLAQARSAVVVAAGAYLKARAALERATGTILDRYGIDPADAMAGKP
jgi:outer membrane protein